MDKSVVDDFRDPYAGVFQLVFEFPQIVIAGNFQGYVIESKRAFYRNAMILFTNVFNFRPFEECDHIMLGYLKKIMPILAAA